MISLCTLFDSNYLDKALVTYQSLRRTGVDFVLYIMCCDDKASDILRKMDLQNVVLDTLEDLEKARPKLIEIKSTRTKAEYCWTCTAPTIEYFIDKYKLSACTYIDADLYFYSSPQALFDEIENSGSDIAIMEHRFGLSKKEKCIQHTSGKYCVEFNYFNNSDNARKALSWWGKVCMEWCYQKFEEENEEHPARYGDQKYLEKFPILFERVHEMQNLGGGVAPWNLRQYELVENNSGVIKLLHKETNTECDLIFYHFQNLKFITHTVVNINSLCGNKLLKNAVYEPYLIELYQTRCMLENDYELSLGIRKSYSTNKLKAFIQRYIMPYKIKHSSDIVNIKKLSQRPKIR